MNIQQKIEIMQHFAAGGSVEFTGNGNHEWRPSTDPTWDWHRLQYRARVIPANLTAPLPPSLANGRIRPKPSKEPMRDMTYRWRGVMTLPTAPDWVKEAWNRPNNVPGSIAKEHDATHCTLLTMHGEVTLHQGDVLKLNAGGEVVIIAGNEGE